MNSPIVTATLTDLRNLFHSLPGNSALLLPDDPHFTIVATTSGYRMVSGKAESELIGKGLFDVFPAMNDLVDRNGDGLFQSLQLVMQLKKEDRQPVHRYDIPGHAGEMEEHFWSVINTPVLNQEGAVQYIIHTTEDVTSQVNMQKGEVKLASMESAHQALHSAYDQLQESEEKYRTLFNSISQGFCVIELIFAEDDNVEDYRFLEVNPMFEKQTGLSNVRGKRIREFRQDLDKQWFELFGNVVKTGKPAHFEEWSSSLKRWFEMYAVPVGDSADRKVALLFSDISERKQSEQSLREKDKNLQAIIHQAPVGMLVLRGADLVVEIINEQATATLGNEQDVVGRPLLQALPEIEDQDVYKALKKVYDTGKPFYGSEWLIPLMKDGKLEEHYFNFAFTPLLENGIVAGVVDVFLDITEQVKARKALEIAHQETERQKRLYEAILNNTLDLQYIFNLDYRFTYANQALLEMWGRSMEDSIGRGLLELGYEPWHAEMHHSEIDQVIATKQPIRGVVSFPHATLGKRVYDYLFVPVFNEQGEVEAIAGTTRDISDLKEAELQLEQRVKERTQELESHRNLLDNILTNSSNGISVTEMVRNDKGEVIDARTILANDAAVKFTGLSREVYMSTLATEIDPNILQSPYGQMCLNTLRTGEPSFSQYFLELTGRWLELTISKMDDDHLIHIFTDVTPIKEAQLQLEHIVEDLKRTNQNLEEFAYAASHDMKEPIRKMHFFADRLKQRLANKLEEEDRSYFERLERSARRMGNLIDDLLTYSNVSRGMDVKEEVDLNAKIQRVLEDLELEISDKQAVVQVGDLPVIHGNKRQLQQLFQNLISNGLKYSKPGIPAKINIVSHMVNGDQFGMSIANPDHEYYLISVKDEGIGFEQKDAERIFNVFTRLHGNNEYRGTGVGLSIAQKVVQNHGGRIWAESAPGEGATFFILLPV